MEPLVRKRSGKVVPFSRVRIIRAIYKAMKASSSGSKEDAEKVADAVSVFLYRHYFKRGDIPHVETIQDIIERKLMEMGYPEAAKAYILYREKRRQAREIGQAIVHGGNLIEEYLNQADWRVRENSNMNYSLQGLNFHVSSAIVAKYWLEKIYPEEVAKAHMEGDFHIHDLGCLSAYCVGWDLRALLERGFGGVPGKVESAQPKHFRSALGQVVNFFYTLQGETAGAQAFSHFDTLLAPFVRYDKLSYEEVKQCLQEFVFNLNIPTRVGFQTPFTNLTFDLKPSKLYANMNVVWGGKVLEDVYGDFHREMTMINQAFCEVMMAGDAKGRIFTFPIPTYNLTQDFDWDNPDYMPLWEMTRKYGTPYFANFVHSEMSPDDAFSMCCRLRLDKRELRKRGGGLFGADPLTGSIGVVTINLPRLGYLSTCEEEFFERLEALMELAKISLEIKRKTIEDFTEKGLYPYCRVYLEEIKKAKGAYWANHFSTIGLVGMNEACENFLGEDITTKSGREFALKVLRFMREKLQEFQEETGNLYNLEATPAEGTSFRLARLDKKRFPRIKTRGTDSTPYYTNSVHPPVYFTDDLFVLLEHQDDLQVMFTGGTVVHLFVGEEIPSWEMVRSLVKAVVEHFKLPYFSITPTFSICPVHGYLPGVHYFCPLPHTEEDLHRFGVDKTLLKVA